MNLEKVTDTYNLAVRVRDESEKNLEALKRQHEIKHDEVDE